MRLLAAATGFGPSSHSIYGRRAIKGPGLKVRYDVRRYWNCPACNRTRRAPIDRVAVRCNCRNDGTWMKLVEPGPAPPPFEVEYSALEADSKPVKDPPESEPETSQEIEAGSADKQGGPASANEEAAQVHVSGTTSSGDKSATGDLDTQPVRDSATESQKENTQAPGTESSSDDAFGTGIEFGDDPANSPPTAAEPGIDTKQESADSGDTESDSNRKKGKRSNRRRRSRRNQKKRNNSDSGSDSGTRGSS